MLVNMHWKTSTVVRMAMLVLIAVILSAATTSAGPVHRNRVRVGRLHGPCAGRHAVPVDLSSATNDVEERVSHHQLRRAVRSISSLLSSLYDDVVQLIADYVSIAFVCKIINTQNALNQQYF